MFSIQKATYVLLQVFSIVLHAYGKAGVITMTAGQEPLYRGRARQSHHLSHLFTHTLCLHSACLLFSGQFQLIFLLGHFV